MVASVLARVPLPMSAWAAGRLALWSRPCPDQLELIASDPDLCFRVPDRRRAAACKHTKRSRHALYCFEVQYTASLETVMGFTAMTSVLRHCVGIGSCMGMQHVHICISLLVMFVQSCGVISTSGTDIQIYYID